MLDPNQPSINFGQVTDMLKEIQQTHKEVVKYGQLPDSGKTPGLNVFSPSFAATIINMQLDSLNAKLEKSSTLFSKSRKCSLWERYWIPIAIGITVGVISALLTNVLLMMR